MGIFTTNIGDPEYSYGIFLQIPGFLTLVIGIFYNQIVRAFENILASWDSDPLVVKNILKSHCALIEFTLG